MKRKHLIKVISILMVVVLVGGIIISVIDGGVGNKNIEKIKEKTDQHTELFTASQSNWGLVSNQEDYWSSSYWTVYYDGTVEYYESYNLSGETSRVTWELSDEDYERLCRNLQGKFLLCNEGVDACDGTGWSMTYHSTDGKKIHNFSGYMYGIQVLEDIVEILDSDMREQAVIEPVEKGDSHNVLLDVTFDNVVEDENADELVSSHWIVYYDGWVECLETYQIGGKQSVITWELDDYAYGKLVRRLKYNSDKLINEEAVAGEDYWAMTCYEETGDEIYSSTATSGSDNIFGAIYNMIQIPEDGYSYVKDKKDNERCKTTYKVGDYSITIDSINPGHSDNAAMFSTYLYWDDSEDSTTTIRMEYSFEQRSLEESRILENMSTTTINGQTYYYTVNRYDYAADHIWLYCKNDDNSFMMIILETTGWHDEDYNWIDETDADIEDLIQDDILEEAVSFKVAK